MIRINLNKAATIAHEKRRAARAKEFEPYDKIIAAQIPGVSAAAAEEARSEIRAKYANIQDNINSAQTIEDLKAALDQINN